MNSSIHYESLRASITSPPDPLAGPPDHLVDLLETLDARPHAAGLAISRPLGSPCIAHGWLSRSPCFLHPLLLLLLLLAFQTSAGLPESLAGFGIIMG